MKKKSIGKFIDPLTDFGFKRLFGSEPNKDLLIDFLNQVLKGRKQIIGLSYNNNEQLGHVKDSRKNVFDLRCTGPDGEQFIIEVQKVRQKFFIDRCIYYTASLVHEQGPKGDPDWDYQLQEVYLIGLMDFSFDDMNPDKYIHDVALLDRETKTVFYDKLGYTFIEIPKFCKAMDQLETELDKWLYVLKNLSRFDKIPVILKEQVFKKLFKIAQTANLTKEEHAMYEASLMQKWDYQNGIDYAVEVAVEKAVEEVVERERAKLLNVAKSMKEDKMPLENIAKYTGMSIAEIEAL